jgi:hypothetical protein
MLLLLLLLLGDDQPRVLIDALMLISRRSAASIAREAHVVPANLSRMRKPSGETQVSSEGQSRLLEALSWSSGRPDTSRLHDWLVRDLDGAKAVDWLLSNRLGGHSEVRRLFLADDDPRSKVPRAWVGRLTDLGGYCSISTNVGQAVENLFPNGLGPAARDIGASVVSPSTLMLLARGQLSAKEIEDLVNGFESDQNMRTGNDELITQLEHLGLSASEHKQILLQWLRDKSVARPELFKERLKTLEKLTIGGKTLRPSGMTERQLQTLMTDLSRS